MKRLTLCTTLLGASLLVGCVAPAPKPNDPYYAPVLPRTPLPAAQNNGAIFQPGFGMDLYNDRKAFRVGDIVTIILQETTQASKKADTSFGKNSDVAVSPAVIAGKSIKTDIGLSNKTDFSGTAASTMT